MQDVMKNLKEAADLAYQHAAPMAMAFATGSTVGVAFEGAKFVDAGLTKCGVHCPLEDHLKWGKEMGYIAEVFGFQSVLRSEERVEGSMDHRPVTRMKYQM